MITGLSFSKTRFLKSSPSWTVNISFNLDVVLNVQANDLKAPDVLNRLLGTTRNMFDTILNFCKFWIQFDNQVDWTKPNFENFDLFILKKKHTHIWLFISWYNCPLYSSAEKPASIRSLLILFFLIIWLRLNDWVNL